MLRLRLAPLAVTAGLLLACGCSTTSTSSTGSGGGFFSRLCGRSRPANDCCCVMESGAPCCSTGCCSPGGCASGCCDGGPPLMDPGAVVVPGAPAMPTAPPPGLPLAPAPRLVPQPVQSQPVPYNPPG